MQTFLSSSVPGVPGRRREEVAMLAGVSVDYYVRLEHGNLSGASEDVQNAIVRTLRLDEAEREYLFDLASAAGPARKKLSSGGGQHCELG